MWLDNCIGVHNMSYYFRFMTVFVMSFGMLFCRFVYELMWAEKEFVGLYTLNNYSLILQMVGVYDRQFDYWWLLFDAFVVS